MKKLIPWLSLVVAAVWLAAGWRPEAKSADGIDTVAFGKLPVLSGGRLKPFDTVARNSLLILNGKQKVKLADGTRIGADRWLIDVLFRAEVADTQPVFLVHNPEVLGLFGMQEKGRKRFAYAEFEPFLKVVDDEGGKAAAVEASQRSAYQTAVLNLRNALVLYQSLRGSMQAPAATDVADEFAAYEATIETGRTAIIARSKGNKPDGLDQRKLDAFSASVNRYQLLSQSDYLRPVPPAGVEGEAPDEWQSIGGSLLMSLLKCQIDPVTISYAQLGDDARAGDAEGFNRKVGDLAAVLAQDEAPTLDRVGFERLFNHIEPFYMSMGLYVLAAMLACGSWLMAGPELRRSAVWVLWIALAIHTFGLAARMYLQGRPPVTNLYSSAVFIGWGTVVIGLVLERIYKDGIGAACAGAIGFVSLIIAHHLAGSGDTLEMLRAVLDTNIWLATHVVVITAGYSAMFLAGMLAIIYIIRGVFTTSLDRQTADSLYRAVYGVVCFATLFSFVGTVLGGIWADQSWGRFWGWDPKENGALLIVLWCAIILHARRAGYIRARGMMIMAVFGNVITSFSWFGVNMLGVGLHSYGFIDKAFWWLVAFVASQLALMAAAAIPTGKWRSFQSTGSQPADPA